ncbi:MAG: holo-ACP synthase [Proteobacteria bacterium]|nr:holo-ACP synthase [Pseudomonadota bacterium]
MLGTGIDIVENDRIRKACKRWEDRFLKRVFTPSEIERAGKRADKSAYFASRFAAKEAFLKALGTGLSGGIKWTDMEVVSLEGRRPLLSVSGRAQEFMDRMGVKTSHLSLSHERKYSIAQVVLEGEAK